MNRICFVVDPAKEDKSAPKLVERIKQLGFDCVQSDKPLDGTFTIGWGKAARTPGLNRLAPRSKLSELQLLRAAKVRTVPMAERFKDALALACEEVRRCREPALLLGRAKTHRKGLDILQIKVSADSPERLPAITPAEREYWTLAVPKRSEYRVHAVCGRVDRVATKVPKSDEARAALVWNQDTCDFRYDRPVGEEPKTLAVAAVTAYGLDFGAVDVLEATDGVCYVLEVNLRPGLNDDMVQYYAEQFIAAAKAA